MTRNQEKNDLACIISAACFCLILVLLAAVVCIQIVKVSGRIPC